MNEIVNFQAVVRRTLPILACLLVLPFKSHSENYRLTEDISVTKQFVELTVTPGDPVFTGSTTLELLVAEPTKHIAYHNHGLVISSVALEHDGKKQRLTSEKADEFDIVRHSLTQGISGKVMLKISFSGKVTDANNIQGLFLLGESSSKPYLFTQFQEMEARRVFPSFDDPSKKTSFSFTLNIPESMDALHNTRPISVVKKGARKIVEFAPTPRINTDVLVLAVGDFESTTLSKTSLKSQVHSPSNETLKLPKDFGVLIEQTTSYISDYLDMPFPYDKLDFFVAPIGTLAAMENVGLVALNTNQLPDNDTSDYELCYFRKLIAHEIAHMWFGNDMTMRWYDDFWLNESFSEFLAANVIQRFYPHNQSCTFIPQSDAFRDDNQHATPIKREVKSRADNEAAGQLYYSKGRAILEMIEEHVGQPLLKKVMREYVQTHHNGNVTTADFTDLFPKEFFVPEIVTTFTEQAGFPLINVSEDSGNLFISQQSYHGEQDKQWTIPLTLKVWDGKSIETHHLVLKNKQQRLANIFPGQSIFVDGSAVGYFRYDNRAADMPFPLDKLTMPERLASIDNNDALANSGQLNYKEYVDGITRLLNDLPSDSLEVEKGLDVLNNSFIELVPATLQNQYAAYLKTRLPQNLPWHTLIKENTGGQWLELYGVHLKSQEAIQFASAYFSETAPTQLKNRVAVLRVLASSSTNTEYKNLLNLFKVDNASVKQDVLDSLGYVSNKQQVKLFYEFLLSDETKGFVIDYRFQFPAFQPKLRKITMEYIQQNRQRISLRIPDDQLQWFPYNFLTSCSAREQNLVNDTFTDWLDVAGLQEKLKVVLERIETCHTHSKQIVKSISRLQ